MGASSASVNITTRKMYLRFGNLDSVWTCSHVVKHVHLFVYLCLYMCVTIRFPFSIFFLCSFCLLHGFPSHPQFVLWSCLVFSGALVSYSGEIASLRLPYKLLFLAIVAAFCLSSFIPPVLPFKPVLPRYQVDTLHIFALPQQTCAGIRLCPVPTPFPNMWVETYF